MTELARDRNEPGPAFSPSRVSIVWKVEPDFCAQQKWDRRPPKGRRTKFRGTRSCYVNPKQSFWLEKSPYISASYFCVSCHFFMHLCTKFVESFKKYLWNDGRFSSPKFPLGPLSWQLCQPPKKIPCVCHRLSTSNSDLPLALFGDDVKCFYTHCSVVTLEKTSQGHSSVLRKRLLSFLRRYAV